MPDTDADPELVQGFIDEALEALDTLDGLFVELERTHDPQVIQAIFRPVHSLKGNSSFFGLDQVRGLAHDLENILDHARRGLLVIHSSTADLLLAGVDQLKAMLRRVGQRLPEVEDPHVVEELRASLRAITGSVPQGTAATPRSSPSRHPLLEALEALPADGLTLAHLDRVPSWAADEQARGAIATFRLDLDEIIAAAGWSSVVHDLLRDALPRLMREYAWVDPAVPSAPVPATVTVPVTRKSTDTDRLTRGTDRRGTVSDRLERDEAAIRVPIANIDLFLSQVGELLAVGDLLTHLEGHVSRLPGSETATRELRQALSIYQQVTSTLRQQVVALRQVPAKRLLQKVTRLVRDVASARGKDIAVILAGEELGLDKAVLDLLDAPLVHLVRNAADHGIELPSDRVAAGKPRQGIIRVSIAENETSMVLTVADDGGGLDLVRIQAKAEEAGLVAAGATLTKDDLVGFIFASGVSTASEVTDISGRGVGLDVVRRAIEGVGGTIGIETERGVGATFSITVPKGARTQIMAGFLVRVADQTFVLPLDRIQRAVALAADQLQRVPERGERLLLDGTTYPHHRLGALTSVAGGGAALAVLIRLGSTVTSLGVDEVLGVRQVLVRPIQSSRFSPMIAGGAIMGDGTVAVVLDPDHLVA